MIYDDNETKEYIQQEYPILSSGKEDKEELLKFTEEFLEMRNELVLEMNRKQIIERFGKH